MNNNPTIFFSRQPHSIYIESYGDPTGAPCLFIPGGYHSGICYSQTPDGRTGWGKLAAERGYYSLLTDMPGTGRSGGVSFESINSEFIVNGYVELIKKMDRKVTLFVHSLSGSIGFKILERIPEGISHLVAVEPSMFGNIQEELIPISESSTSVTVDFHGLNLTIDMTKCAPAAPHVIDRFTTKNNPKKTLFPKYSQDHLDQYAASLQNQHPQLMYELFNIKGSKLKIDNFETIKNIPILIITSPDDPLHKDDDIKIVNKLRDENCSVEHWDKGSHGTEGSSHMMMVETNNDILFTEIHNWILSHS